MTRTVKLNEVVVDPSVYPRRSVSNRHVETLAASIKATGFDPTKPIIVEHGTLRVVDGVHRVHAARSVGQETIPAVIKTYGSDAELFAEALATNSSHGLGLDTYDQVWAAEIGSRLGMSEGTLAAALRTSIQHLRAIAKRYATLEEAQQDISELRHAEPSEVPISELRRVPLKASVRHLSGATISREQADAIESAPGQSYILSVRQIIDALQYNLMPPYDQHPALWHELWRLRSALHTISIPETATA